MQEPVFPQKFVLNHCPKVIEARDWRKIYKVPGTEEDDILFAECAFVPAGCGMVCQSCNEFLAGVQRNKVEKDYLDLIVKYYDDSKEYDKQCQKEEKMKVNLGAGI